MAHIHINTIHPMDIDIYVNISMKNFTNSTPKKDIVSPINENEHIYDYLYDEENNSNKKKIYTLQQILDNVESIQQQYEQIIENSLPSSLSCFLPFKQMTKIFKNFKFLRHKPIEQPQQTNQIEDKSPFIFGGKTFHWIALPQYNDHVYENELIS